MAKSLLDEVLARVEGMSPEAREELSKQVASEPVRNMVPTQGPQCDAYFSKADVLLYGGQAGSGKLQAVDNEVLTPFGFKAIGDLAVGDRVCAVDGTATEVIGVFPQGNVELYRVTMADGGSTEAGLEHLWLAWPVRLSRKIGNAKTCGEDAAAKYTTADLIEGMRKGRRYAVPVCHPVAFNVAGSLKGRGNFIARPIDPYLLGLLIGDGSFTRQVNITSADEEILSAVREFAGPDVRIAERPGNAAKGAHLRGPFLKKVIAALRDLGLFGLCSQDKFIPRQYKMAPVEERFALLQGLMDTDGWAEPKKACYYTTVSKTLADDVVFLARSLGAITSVSEKSPTYTHKGEKKKGRKAYCIRIKLRDPTQCFRLERKRVIAAGMDHQSHSRSIKSIEFSRMSQAVCIAVRHPSSLYITDDFIVTHNTALSIGLASQEHKRSIIFRRESSQTDGLEAFGKEMIGDAARFNGQDLEWNWPDGRSMKLAGMKEADDWIKHAGRERDFIGFDEAGEFLLTQVASMLAWNRGPEGQRCRMVLASNPPRTTDGLWMIEWFAPWIDKKFPNPAAPGELRWAVFVAGKPHWRDGPDDLMDVEGEPQRPLSLTFIPASLADNPWRNTPEYRSRLQSLPEPLRSQLLYGDFAIGLKDNANQCIPTGWVDAAQKRWTAEPPEGVPMCSMGVDASGGGDDPLVIAPRYDGWYAPLIEVEGKKIPQERIGPYCAGLVVSYRRDSAHVVIDMGGGYGGSTYDHLKQNNVGIHAYKGAEATTKRTADGQLKFVNKRSAAHWMFREALDPGQPGGSPIALPPDQQLLGDLTAPTFEVTPNGIKLEPKEKVMARIGRSPDCFVAGTMIATPTGERPIETIRVGDEVVTPLGSRRVIAVHKQDDQAITTASYNGGAILCGKHAHRVFTWNRGWVRLDELRDEHVLEQLSAWNLLAWRLRNLCSTPTSDTAFKHQVDTINLTGRPTRSAFYTGVSGRTFMGQLLSGSISTTLTETGQTILWLICKQLIEASTAAVTAAKGWLIRRCGQLRSKVSARGVSLQRNGMRLTLAAPGTQNMQSAFGPSASQFKRYANAAAGHLKPGREAPDSAQQRASNEPPRQNSELWSAHASNAGRHSWRTNTSRRSVAAGSAQAAALPGTASVYDLTVERDHVYYANGVLVENCGDAVVMAWFEGPRKITHALEWLEQGQSLGLSGRTVRRPQVINNGRQPLSVRSRR